MATIQEILSSDSGSQAAEKINDNFTALNQEIGQGGGNVGSVEPTLRVLAWNIGHFAIGGSSSPSITNADYDTMRTKWKKAINETCANVLLLSEYDPNFGSHTVDGATVTETAKDALFNQYYPYDSIGIKDGYACNTIYSKLALTDPDPAQVAFTDRYQNCYYRISTITIGGKTIKLVATHLDWSITNSARIYRSRQIQQLIDTFKNEPYVIIGGDFNLDAPREFDGIFTTGNVSGFASSGFKLANHGNLGDIYTFPATGARNDARQFPDLVLDNIIVRGFDITNVQLVDNGELTDHCGIMCDLIMI